MTDTGNGGIAGAVSRPVSKAIGALSGTPMLLVLTLLNVMMFGMMTYLIVQSAQYRFKERADLIQMLTRCIYEHDKRDGSFSQKMGVTVLPQGSLLCAGGSTDTSSRGNHTR
jgi:hypothetical protein